MSSTNYSNFFNKESNINRPSSVVSKVRKNREYLISNHIKDELNVYRLWRPFQSNSEYYQVEYSVDGNKVTKTPKSTPARGVRSLFNRAGAVLLGDMKVKWSDPDASVDITQNSSSWRMGLNAPLMDNPSIRTKIKQDSGCSVKELVEASQLGLLGREIYSYADFMYCKHLGKMPNSYMVTLRRFPTPVDDYISSSGIGADRNNKLYKSQNMQSIGCMVTWMGVSGNDMSNILKYTVSLPFKEETAQWEQGGASADTGHGIFNSIAAAMDPAYRNQYQRGFGGDAFNAYIGGMFGTDNGPYTPTGHQDRHKVYGPVDAIKTTYMRSEEGLKFEQNINLTFEYELRSYNGINARQAMLDLISNILNVTYSTGTFWGGGYTGGGMHQNNIFSNLNIFKTSGGFTDFVDALQKDFVNLSGMARNKIKENAAGDGTIMGIIRWASSMLNQLGGMVMGGLLNKLGRPQRAAANSLLSPAPVGFWHVTVGNPHHPIMSLGNMVLKNTTIEHTGPLGLDDFPTGLKVTCELTKGKGRDLREIEAMYMKGQDRIYTSMSERVFEMYKNAIIVGDSTGRVNSYRYDGANERIELTTTTQIKDEKGNIIGTVYGEDYVPEIDPKDVGSWPTEDTGEKQDKNAYNEPELEFDPKRTTITSTDIDSLKATTNIIQKYFGEVDAYSIYFAAAEQEYGATYKTGAREKQKTVVGSDKKTGQGKTGGAGTDAKNRGKRQDNKLSKYISPAGIQNQMVKIILNHKDEPKV